MFVLSVYDSLVITCWERADLLALRYVKFSCVFVTFPYGVLSHVRYLSVLIPDRCLLPYFEEDITNIIYLEKTENKDRHKGEEMDE